MTNGKKSDEEANNNNNACSQFTSDNPGKVVDKNVFPELYKQAYYAGFTAGNIKSGFRSCGIHPFNSDAVPDSMMAPSLVTDQPAPPAAPSAPPTLVETSDLEDNDAICVLLAQWLTWLTQTVVVTQRCRVQSPLTARTFLEQESLIT